MSEAILTAVLKANLVLALAVLAILALRRPVRQRFGPLAGYALWLVAPICVAANLAPVHAPPAVAAPVLTLVGAGAKSLAPVTQQAANLSPLLTVVWVIGVLVVASFFALRQAQFVRALGRLTPLESDPAILRGEHLGGGPMLLGAVRPRIVVPADFEARFTGLARRLVLDHERVHQARGDAAVNALVVTLRCLAWFNPVIHLGARRFRVDQEIACDAAVTAARPDTRRLYAELLLGAAMTPFSAPFGCHWPATGVHPLKERLLMLNVVSTTTARRRLGLALVGAIALAGAGAVWAATPAPAAYVVAPDWATKPTIQELARFYPSEAQKTKLEGMAVIDCRVTIEGKLTHCKVVREGPEQAGFGQAAIQLSEYFQMKPATLNGKPTAGGVVRIPLKFSVP
jgi:TonB family protein